jgi:hypothetical protein
VVVGGGGVERECIIPKKSAINCCNINLYLYTYIPLFTLHSYKNQCLIGVLSICRL